MALVLDGTTGIVSANIADGTISASDLASGAITSAALPAGSVVRAIQTVYTGITSGTNNVYPNNITNFADSGLQISITPQSASNKILVLASIATSSSVEYERVVKRLVRNGVSVYAGVVVGNRAGVIDASTRYSANGIDMTAFQFLDSPSTTSSITYKVQLASAGGGTPIWYVNCSQNDANNSEFNPRAVSSITLLEIAG